MVRYMELKVKAVIWSITTTQAFLKVMVNQYQKLGMSLWKLEKF